MATYIEIAGLVGEDDGPIYIEILPDGPGEGDYMEVEATDESGAATRVKVSKVEYAKAVARSAKSKAGATAKAGAAKAKELATAGTAWLGGKLVRAGKRLEKAAGAGAK